MDYAERERKRSATLAKNNVGRPVGSHAMPCSACGFDLSRTSDSRSVTAVPSIGNAPARRRRRVCCECGHKWTTYEVTEDAMITGVRRLVPAGVRRVIEKLIADSGY